MAPNPRRFPPELVFETVLFIPPEYGFNNQHLCSSSWLVRSFLLPRIIEWKKGSELAGEGGDEAKTNRAAKEDRKMQIGALLSNQFTEMGNQIAAMFTEMGERLTQQISNLLDETDPKEMATVESSKAGKSDASVVGIEALGLHGPVAQGSTGGGCVKKRLETPGQAEGQQLNNVTESESLLLEGRQLDSLARAVHEVIPHLDCGKKMKIKTIVVNELNRKLLALQVNAGLKLANLQLAELIALQPKKLDKQVEKFVKEYDDEIWPLKAEIGDWDRRATNVIACFSPPPHIIVRTQSAMNTTLTRLLDQAARRLRMFGQVRPLVDKLMQQEINVKTLLRDLETEVARQKRAQATASDDFSSSWVESSPIKEKMSPKMDELFTLLKEVESVVGKNRLVKEKREALEQLKNKYTEYNNEIGARVSSPASGQQSSGKRSCTVRREN